MKSPRTRVARKAWVSYEDAATWAQQSGITSQTQWRQRSKLGLPDGVPSNPDKTYPDFKGWGHFLGTGQLRTRDREYVSYEEAAAWAQKEGIKTNIEWRSRMRLAKPKEIPAKPEKVYANNFKGWGHFLGTGRVHNKHKPRVTYEEAMAWAKEEGIATRYQWHKKLSENTREDIPYDPQRAYPGKFKSWGDFLGTGRTPRNRTLISYEEAAAWARQEGIINSTQWRKRMDQGVPEGIPVSPRQVYGDKFKSWGDFLGTGVTSRWKKVTASYQEASEWAQQEGIFSITEWLERSKNGTLPERMPTDLRKAYSNFVIDGGPTTFFGVGGIPQMSKAERCLRHVMEEAFNEKSETFTAQSVIGASGKKRLVDVVLPKTKLIIEYDGSYYHKEREQYDITKTFDLLDAGWEVIRVRGSTPQNRLQPLREPWDVVVKENETIHKQIGVIIDHILSLHDSGVMNIEADIITRLSEWKGSRLHNYPFRNILLSYDGWLSYSEVSSWAQKEGITSRNQWMERVKAGLPKGIPASPRNVYLEEFNSWGEFLGTGAVHHKDRKFVSYDEAAEWARAEGITTSTEWRGRSKKGLPEGIPSNPNRTYFREFQRDGWGGFLGTGSAHPRDKTWAKYSEASSWAQSEGIKTSIQWGERCRQGLPENIPANPNQMYKEEFQRDGWGGFLGTGKPSNKNRKFKPYEEAAAWARAEGINTYHQWKKRCSQGLPHDIPSHPEMVYASDFLDGGWRKFLGTEKVANNEQHIERKVRKISW